VLDALRDDENISRSQAHGPLAVAVAQRDVESAIDGVQVNKP
jgi:hypothetical protein